MGFILRTVILNASYATYFKLCTAYNGDHEKMPNFYLMVFPVLKITGMHAYIYTDRETDSQTKWQTNPGTLFNICIYDIYHRSIKKCVIPSVCIIFILPLTRKTKAFLSVLGLMALKFATSTTLISMIFLYLRRKMTSAPPSSFPILNNGYKCIFPFRRQSATSEWNGSSTCGSKPKYIQFLSQ